MGRGLRNLAFRWGQAMLLPRPVVGLFRLPHFFVDWRRYQRASQRKELRLIDSYPCLLDATRSTPFDPHYFYQGAWLARRLRQRKPRIHVDIGSSVMSIGVLSGAVDTIFIDYRPLKTALPGLSCVAADITRLPLAAGQIASLSCLHVIEHIGLGRYGDPINPDGSRLAAAEIARVIGSRGCLYLSTPVGRPRVCFNAHRVFAPEQIPEMFPRFVMREFSYVDDHGVFHEHERLAAAAGDDYACGMYVLEREDG